MQNPLKLIGLTIGEKYPVDLLIEAGQLWGNKGHHWAGDEQVLQLKPREMLKLPVGTLER